MKITTNYPYPNKKTSKIATLDDLFTNNVYLILVNSRQDIMLIGYHGDGSEMFYVNDDSISGIYDIDGDTSIYSIGTNADARACGFDDVIDGYVPAGYIPKTKVSISFNPNDITQL